MFHGMHPWTVSLQVADYQARFNLPVAIVRPTLISSVARDPYPGESGLRGCQQQAVHCVFLCMWHTVLLLLRLLLVLLLQNKCSSGVA